MPLDNVPLTPDTDTTYRVPGHKVEDLVARALAAYFPPDEIRWLPKNVKNGRCLALPYLTARAVQDRLDSVLGADGWCDVYELLPDGKTVKCSLAVRFDPASDKWVTKSDVGAPSEQPDEGDRMKSAFSDALKRAAVKFGVGRYLYGLGNQWCEYDQAKRMIVNPPPLPLAVIPLAYRPYTAERRRQIADLLANALKLAKVPAELHAKAAVNLLGDYGYSKNETHLVENRHADAMHTRLTQWINDTAKKVANSPYSPLYAPEAPAKAVECEKPQNTKQPPKDEKKGTGGDGKGKDCVKPPATGAQLIARLELKDKELADAGRIQRDALKAHVIAEGAKSMYSADITKWGPNAVAAGVKWATEFIEGLPSAEHADTGATDEQEHPGYAVAQSAESIR